MPDDRASPNEAFAPVSSCLSEKWEVAESNSNQQMGIYAISSASRSISLHRASLAARPPTKMIIAI